MRPVLLVICDGWGENTDDFGNAIALGPVVSGAVTSVFVTGSFQTVADLRSSLRDVTVEDPWSSDLAAKWWSCNGCPERKKMSAELVEAAAV